MNDLAGMSGGAYSFIPKLAPWIFVYFDLVGSYVPVQNQAMAVGINAAVGDVFGEVVWDFLTGSSSSIKHLLSCAVVQFIGAFVAVQFLLPMTGITPGNLMYASFATLGGHLAKWVLSMFNNK